MGNQETDKQEIQPEKDEVNEGEAVEAPLKKSKKKLIFIIIFLFLLLGSGGGILLYLKKHKAEEERKKQEAEQQVSKKEIIYYDLDEMIVNLNTEGKGVSFLKLKVTFEVEGNANLLAVKTFSPRIKDTLQLYLRELRPEDMQGSVGPYRLKEELLLRINKIIYPANINDILFKDILVQ